MTLRPQSKSVQGFLAAPLLVHHAALAVDRRADTVAGNSPQLIHRSHDMNQ